MKSNRLIIAGGRDFNNWELLKENCTYYTFLLDQNDIEIVSGKQVSIDKDTGEMYGADYLGERWAKENGFEIISFPADWKKFGKPAGPIRNKAMAAYGTHLIAFWDGKSDGTGDMIDHVRAAGYPKERIKIVKY